MSNFSIYNYTVKDAKGKSVSLSDYKGKILLIVNTATQCGLAPQFRGLDEIYRRYKDKGFEILAFPSNQFANQEPGSDEEIQGRCEMVFDTSFPIMSKIDVNGKNADPLYKDLKKELKGLLGGRIKWNFTKFLIGKDGKPIKRFSPVSKPKEIESYVIELLANS